MAGRDRREAEEPPCVIVLHLLKWQAQPAWRGASWRKSLRTQRREIRELLRAEPEPASAGAGADAGGLSGRDQGCRRRDGAAADRFPAACPYAPDEVLAEDHLPEADLWP